MMDWLHSSRPPGWTSDLERVLQFVRQDRIRRNIVPRPSRSEVHSDSLALPRESEVGFFLFYVLPNALDCVDEWFDLYDDPDILQAVLRRIDNAPEPVL